MNELSEAPVERVLNQEEVKSLFNVNSAHKDIAERLIDIVTSSGAILKGHFSLESGRHSNSFFRFADVASRADDVNVITKALISDIERDHLSFDVVMTQPSGGRVLGEVIAKQLNKRIIFTYADDHNRPLDDLVNPEYLFKGDRVLIVSDVFTSGSGLSTMLNSVRTRGAVPVAIALFVERDSNEFSQFLTNEKIKVYSLGTVNFESTSPSCKLDERYAAIPSWQV